MIILARFNQMSLLSPNEVMYYLHTELEGCRFYGMSMYVRGDRADLQSVRGIYNVSRI